MFRNTNSKYKTISNGISIGSKETLEFHFRENILGGKKTQKGVNKTVKRS